MTSRSRSKTDAAELIQSGIAELLSGLKKIDFDETTIPDAFRKMPKFISPRLHAWLDVAVTGYFLAIGALFAIRGKGGAATSAFINAGMVAGVSLFTDYKGTGKK